MNQPDPTETTAQYVFRVSEIRDGDLKRNHGYFASLSGAHAYCETQERKPTTVPTARFELFPDPGGDQWLLHIYAGPEDDWPDVSDLVISRHEVAPDQAAPAAVPPPDPTTDRRDRYAQALGRHDAKNAGFGQRFVDEYGVDAETDGFVDAVLAVADVEQAELRARVRDSLRRADEATARAEAMERAMRSTAADASAHRFCHMRLMAQCQRAEKAEAEVGEAQESARRALEQRQQMAGERYALQEERDRLRERVADYENRITWHTTCASCARILDSSIQASEQTEAYRLALSEALGLGNGAPWDAIQERAAELAAAPSAPTSREVEVARAAMARAFKTAALYVRGHSADERYGRASISTALCTVSDELARMADDVAAVPAAEEQPENETPCGPVPDACDSDDGPCARHEREQSHRENDHSLCRRDECSVLRQS